MNINFNNVRVQACNAYNRLAGKLNSNIIKDDQYAKPNGIEWEVNIKGYVLIEVEEIEKVMQDLRAMIGTIASTYEEGNEKFADVYPEKQLEEFNPEPEEDATN